MFSVVIPLYNKEQSIANTIQSVLDQTFKDFEIVVVNDGSTDKSVERVKEFDDSRIRIIDKPNGGVSSARNRGIKEARYEWIAFLDGDDLWEKDFLSEIYKTIIEYKENKIFVGGQYIYLNNKSFLYSNEYLPKKGETGVVNLYKVICKYNPPIHSSNAVVFKDLLYKRGFFREGQKNFEDHDLWIRLCIDEDLVYVNKKLSVHSKVDDNRASSGVFLAKDFISFISRFREVEPELSQVNQSYFKRYYNKFIFISFIRFKHNYSDTDLYVLMSEIKKTINISMYLCLYILSFVKTSSLFSSMRFVKRKILFLK